ncbi:MAG: (d)CMP kinase [Steroidobacteraceae bacterium]
MSVPARTIVTIDGPSGSGKGTISRRVARYAGWQLLDSGALYRLVALAGKDQGLAPDDVVRHAATARTMIVEFGSARDGEELVRLQGQDVTRRIRTEEAGAGASRVAAWQPVRDALMLRQRDFAEAADLVADGRDMGTVVFPSAALKIFLTASAGERARRRHNQLKDKGSGVSLAALSREIAERDARDSSRVASPLVPASDSVLIDSTHLGIDAVVERVISLGRERKLWP